MPRTKNEALANDTTIGRSQSKRIACLCLLLILCHWGDAFSTRASHDVRANPSKRRVTLETKTFHQQPHKRKLGIDGRQDLIRSSNKVGPLKVSSAANSGDLSNLIPTKQEEGNTLTAREDQILKDYRVPNVKDLLAFSIPAIGVWLCVPLLSMIDTSTVGLIAGTTQQAALMSAIAAINYSSKAMAFLFSGTTTMMAAAQEADRRESSMDKPRTAHTLVGALQLSTLVGIGLGASVFVFARQLLGLIIGTGSSPAIMGAAMKYVQIRALGFPAAGMLGSAQTACLAQRDIRMPLMATAICALTNLCLDMILIRNPHAWIGGAAGAAWATTISQYIAAGWAMKWLTRTTTRHCKQREQNESSSSSDNSCVSHSTRGFLAGRISLRDLVKRPTEDISKGFSPYVIPVFTTQMGRCSASAAIDHVVSSSLSTASMAANQILTSVYYGLVPVAESLSLAAQNFVPGITERQQQQGKADEASFAMRRLLKNFVKAAGLCGLFLASIMGTLPLYSGAFTADATVRGLVTAVVPLIFVTCLKHGLFCTSEGILLGQKDLKFLGGQYGIYTFMIPYILLQVKKAALGGSTRVGLVTVWQIFLGYDLFRTALMMARIAWLERKRARKEDTILTTQSTSP